MFQFAGSFALIIVGVVFILILLPGIPETIGQLLNRKVQTRRWEKSTKNTILAIGIFLILFGVFITTSSSADKSHSPFAPSFSQRINIQKEYYHIGDVNYVYVIQDGKIVGMTPFAHMPPQNNPFVKEFSLPFSPSYASLYITAKSIDPNEKASPVKVFINGNFICLLNSYFQMETMDEKSVVIEINPAFFLEGINNLQIFVETTIYTDYTKNIDDIEFRDVYLDIRP